LVSALFALRRRGVIVTTGHLRAEFLKIVTTPDNIVFVVDDDASMREALELLFKSVGLEVLSYDSPQSFLEAARPDVPSCLVLDVQLPGLSGLDLQERLFKSGVDIPIVFVTGHANVPMTVRAMKAGAIEFLTKPIRDQDILDAVDAALERDRAARQARDEQAEIRRRFASLTPREREVLVLVAAGRLNKEIAAELGTSLVTVKLHRAHVMQKMQAGSLAELVKMFDKLTP
jgi:FixJ family two-component response regulator